MLLVDFQSIRPKYETAQQETLEWLIAAHGKAGGSVREKLWHVGCKPDRIAKRGHVLADFLHQNWSEMEIYQLDQSSTGKKLSDRMQVFEIEADRVFERFYPEGSEAPDDLIHVSCTGYVSPSSAQKIVSQRGWGAETTVTHCYHMGCYGSMPAIRIARGLLKEKADIVHTEICSLHTNPSLHQLDQLVSQSLFADGFMKYSVVRHTENTHLRILNLREEIIPDSTKAMTWNVADWGFQMSLAKEVPVHITRYLPSYLERLCKQLPIHTLFAIHPGGPKILLHVQKLLSLRDEQMRFSFEVLKEYGNMSSATLPHIWQKILLDETVPDGTPIVSLAFGPGLTISGSFMEKVCGSIA
jgi:predicted naringenin-chalcone synthase